MADDSAASISSKPLQPKKSWADLRQMVRVVRRQLSTISSKIPTNFSFQHLHDEYGHPITHIYFVSSYLTGRETTLLYVSISPRNTSNNAPQGTGGGKLPVLSWLPVLESSFQVMLPHKKSSREEQLQWERKRLVMWGITTYDFHQESGRFVFSACGTIFFCGTTSQSPPFYPQELISNHTGARLNATICPWNPDLVAFVFNYDIWVYHIPTQTEVRLTYSRKGNEEEPISAGIPSYVTQEEFNRYIGFWWQPICYKGENVYRILFEEIDESDVEILHLPSYSEERGLEEFRFPRAGSPNAQSTIKMVSFTLFNSKIENVTTFHLEESLNSINPKYEYLVRLGWTEDGKQVWAQLLDRKQENLQLILIPLSSFIVSQDEMKDIVLNHTIRECCIQTLQDERSTVWINVHDILLFLPQEDPQEIQFIWASEETGFRHLYLLTIGLKTGQSIEDINSIEESVLKSKIALTSGEWEVSEKDVFLDLKNRLVYFIGLKETPLERHLYVVSLDRPKELAKLTRENFCHTIYMDNLCSMFVDIMSNISTLPFGKVFELSHSCHPGTFPNVADITVRPLGYIMEPQTPNPDNGNAIIKQPIPDFGCPLPELFTYKLQSEHVVYGMVFKPPNMVPNQKYPTVLTIYGGPEVQLVTNTYKGLRHLRQHLLANAGYVVIAMDCRGSRHRGLAFESHIKFRMGTVEIAEQVEVILGLAANTEFIDIKRIAIHGWSYGGYLSLMGILQRPDVFKLCIAGAPVTSWNLYDTGYTERYMDTPSNNPQGYCKGSILAYINDFPDEENRLMIMHGLMDENVHFAHTSQLITSLVKAGKPYQLQIYPTERHSLRHLDASEHYEITLLSYLQQHL